MVVLNVQGMTCGGCAASVEKIIRRADPAAIVRVDLASGRVEAETSAEAAMLAEAVSAAGYQAKAA
jgi:copper chaperone